MVPFIIRRLLISFLVLLAATFIVYVLVANAGDPRSALYESTDPGKETKIAALTRNLSLDVPACLVASSETATWATRPPVPR